MFSFFKNVIKFKLTLQVNYITRNVTGQILTPLTEKTLTGRFIIYLNKYIENNVKKVKNVYEIFDNLNLNTGNIKNFPIHNIRILLCALNDRKHVQTKKDFNKLFHVIDQECCNRLSTSDTNTILMLLHSFITGIPNRIVQSSYYNLAMESLVTKVDNLNNDQLVQLIFFVGLMKNSTKAQMYLRKCLTLFNNANINSLTNEDLCIICNSTFKTSTKIKNNQLLYKIKLHLYENLSILKDPAVFITFIKTLRHNRYQDGDILDTIAYTIFFNKCIDHYSFTAVCHILALYADYLYYNDTLIKQLTNRGLEQLKNSQYTIKNVYLEDRPRIKDLKIFLWALSNLNCKLNKNDIEEIIIPHIKQRIIAEFKSNRGPLIDILLYLWIMQYRAYDLIEQILTTENINFVKANNIASKKSVNLLLTCLRYEDYEFFKHLNVHAINESNYNKNIQLEKRPALQNTVKYLEQCNPNALENCALECQVPFLNIIGIVGNRKKLNKLANIEVLDSYTCLKNTGEKKIPSGLMQLKLRLLKTLKEDLIVLEEDCASTISQVEFERKLFPN